MLLDWLLGRVNLKGEPQKISAAGWCIHVIVICLILAVFASLAPILLPVVIAAAF